MNLIPDWTAFPMWLIFISTFVALNFLIIKPTLQIISERQKRTVGFQKEAALLEKEAAILLQQYETKMNEARNQARQLRDSILVATHNEQREAIQKARQIMDAELSLTRKEIRANIQQVREVLKKQTEEFATEITKKLLEREAA